LVARAGGAVNQRDGIAHAAAAGPLEAEAISTITVIKSTEKRVDINVEGYRGKEI
jgi:hypothetical protein